MTSQGNSPVFMVASFLAHGSCHFGPHAGDNLALTVAPPPGTRGRPLRHTHGQWPYLNSGSPSWHTGLPSRAHIRAMARISQRSFSWNTGLAYLAHMGKCPNFTVAPIVRNWVVRLEGVKLNPNCNHNPSQSESQCLC